MGNLELYNIPLIGLASDNQEYEFILTDDFFEKIDNEEVKGGDVKASVLVRKTYDGFEIDYSIEGEAVVLCDRCLDDLTVEVDGEESLKVRLGADFDDDGEVVTVPESDGNINLAWFLYELIVLSTPTKRVHPTGGCNKTMMKKYKKHYVRGDEEDDDSPFEQDEDGVREQQEIDPRWEALRNISDNN